MSNDAHTASPIEWPDADTLREVVARWADNAASVESTLARVGYVGSFAPAGSEEETHLDVVLIVDETDVPPAERVTMWDLSGIPVPTQPLVYTRSEWDEMVDGDGWLARKLQAEAVWVHEG